jgi:DedD protein
MLFEDSADDSREVNRSDLAIPAAPVQNFSEDNPIPQSPQQVLHATEEETAVTSRADEQAEDGEAPSEESGGQQALEEAAQTAEPEQAIAETEEEPAVETVQPPAVAVKPPSPKKPKAATAVPAAQQKTPPVKKVKPQPQLSAAQPLQEPQQPVPVQKYTAPAVQPAKVLELQRWVVQLGSFSKKDNADGLVNKLRAQGFNAYGDTIEAQGKGTMYRVRIGPELDKKRAQATQKKLQQLNTVNSILLTE